MSNSNTSKRINLATFIAILLAVVIVVGAVLGCGYHFGWFSKEDEEEVTEEVSAAGAVISDGESNGITLLSASLNAAAGSTAESTYELTATVTPSYATNPEVVWSIAWDTTVDEYTDDWYSDGDSEYCASELDVTDFVDISATTGSSITVSCYQPFGCPIIVTASTTDGTDLTATCQVDYQAHVTGVSLSTYKLADLSSASTSTASIGYTVDVTHGTIAADYTVSYSVETGLDSINTYIYEYGAYWQGKKILNYESEVASGTSTSKSGTIITYSTDWETLFKSFIVSTYTYDTSMLADIYTAYNACGYTKEQDSTSYIYRVTVSVKDNIKSTSYSDSNEYYLNSLDNYPTYSTTGLSLNTTNITF